jgi:hypothetical protein
MRMHTSSVGNLTLCGSSKKPGIRNRKKKGIKQEESGSDAGEVRAEVEAGFY